MDHAQAGADARAAGRSPTSAAVLPAVGPSFEEQLSLFRKNAAELRADFRLCKDTAALVAELKGLAPRRLAARGLSRAAS